MPAYDQPKGQSKRNRASHPPSPHRDHGRKALWTDVADFWGKRHLQPGPSSWKCLKMCLYTIKMTVLNHWPLGFGWFWRFFPMQNWAFPLQHNQGAWPMGHCMEVTVSWSCLGQVTLLLSPARTCETNSLGWRCGASKPAGSAGDSYGKWMRMTYFLRGLIRFSEILILRSCFKLPEEIQLWANPKVKWNELNMLRAGQMPRNSSHQFDHHQPPCSLRHYETWAVADLCWGSDFFGLEQATLPWPRLRDCRLLFPIFSRSIVVH